MNKRGMMTEKSITCDTVRHCKDFIAIMPLGFATLG